MRLTIIALCALALAGCGGPAPDQTPGKAEVSDAAESGAPGLDRSHKGKPAPNTAFKDADGEDITLADFAGKPVLVNLWATWCAPCVKELPTLDRLSKTAATQGFAVIAVSQDSGPQPSVAAFLTKYKIAELDPYHDPGMRLSGALNAQILPTSILYDASGNEVWRFIGDLDWTGAEAAKLLAEGGATKG